MTAVVAVAVAARSGAGAREEYVAAGPPLEWLLGGLGLLGVVAFVPATWLLLGHMLVPARRSVLAHEAFLGAAAHDLRTPLATLAVLMETAQEETRETGAAGEMVRRAARLVSRTGDTVDDLLLRARLAGGVQPVSLRPTRLDHVVEAVVADLAATELDPLPDGSGDDGDSGGEGWVSTVDLDGHTLRLVTRPVVADLDPRLAERAVANLVQNALRHGHSPSGAAEVTVTVCENGGRPSVTVSDAGPGLRPPVRAGLGLSVVRWVARVHAGRLLLAVGPDGVDGATIRLLLPASSSANRGP